MRNILLIASLIFISSLNVHAQQRERFKDIIHNLPAKITKFVPEGYVAIDTTYGDLNKDTIPDLVLVTCDPDEETKSDVINNPSKRPLLLLIGQADGSYTLGGRNDDVVYCVDCGGMMGDPFMGIAVKNGYFSVEHYGGSAWRWTHIITFKYNKEKQNWFLHKVGGDSFHATDPENIKTKVKTVKDFGIIPFEKYNPEN